MDTAKMTNLAIAAGILYAAYRFAPGAALKTAVLGVAGVAVARQIPYLNTVI